MSRIAFLLIPGSFCPPAVWSPVVPFLESSGAVVRTFTLPSSVERPEGPASMQDDAIAMRAALTDLADQDFEIVLAMNSYGGFPGTEACQGVGAEERRKAGKTGGVVSLAYIASFLAPVGVTSNEMMAGEGPDSISEGTSGVVDPVPEATAPPIKYMTLNPDADFATIFSDLDEQTARRWMAQLSTHSVSSFNDPLTYPAYLYIPTAFWLPKDDKIIPTQKQRDMIANVEAQGVKINVHVADAGHVPMVSQPEAVAKFLLTVVPKP